jgi:hypothetical protein
LPTRRRPSPIAEAYSGIGIKATKSQESPDMATFATMDLRIERQVEMRTNRKFAIEITTASHIAKTVRPILQTWNTATLRIGHIVTGIVPV